MVSEFLGMDCVAPLFVPADRPERFEKAARSGADALILDLEDAVAAEAKVAARGNLRADFSDLPIFVRVNAVGTPWHDEDIARVEQLAIAGIVLPKSARVQDLERLNSRHPVVALVETAIGLVSARTLASHPKVGRLAFGSIDFSADLGCAHDRGILLAARCELVLASRAGDLIAPLDGVTASLQDVALTKDDAQHAGSIGFGGKLCIHPRQISAVLAGLRPSEGEIVWAQQVLATGDGVAVLGASMIDEPARRRARQILARAERRHPR